LREGYLRFGKPRKRRAGRNPSGRTDWHARHGHLSTRRTPPVSRATQEIRGEHDSALREKVRKKKWRDRSRGGLRLRDTRRIFSGDLARRQRTQASRRSAAASAPELRDTGEFA